MGGRVHTASGWHVREPAPLHDVAHPPERRPRPAHGPLSWVSRERDSHGRLGQPFRIQDQAREKSAAGCLLLGAVVTWKGVTLEFDSWYHAEYPRLVNSIGLVIGDRALAADAVAEAFTKALSRWDRVKRMQHPTGWVYRVAMNEAKRSLRRGAQERRLLQAQASTSAAVVAPVEGDHDLWQAVAGLPERMRAVVVLRYVADLTEPKIAETLGIRRGTVATMLRRAHERLARELGPSTQTLTTRLAPSGAL